MDYEKKVGSLVDYLRGAGGYLTWDELGAYLGHSVFQNAERRTVILGDLERAGLIEVIDGSRVLLRD